MILYSLRCIQDHTFDAWFRDGATYDRQAASGEIVCPVCGDAGVSKAPMAPRIASGRNRRPSPEALNTAKMHTMLRELRAHIEANCEHVGDAFAEEARKIHYGDADRRDIYGNASEGEVNALADEGIEVARIPWLPRNDA